jgi:serine/threonine protein phosphatase PrpC
LTRSVAVCAVSAFIVRDACVRAGKVASAAAIQSLRSHDAEAPPGALLEVLGRAVMEASREVALQAAGDPTRRGMGTTLTAMLFSGDRVALAYIGDLRAFRVQDGQLRQITEDHTIGNLVWDAGLLAPVLARYVDGRPDRSADLGLRDLRAGDRYLLCSDGLSPVVDDGTLRNVLTSAADPACAVRQLVALAEDAGAPDTVTVVIYVRPAEEGLAPAVSVTLGSAAARGAVR